MKCFQKYSVSSTESTIYRSNQTGFIPSRPLPNTDYSVYYNHNITDFSSTRVETFVVKFCQLLRQTGCGIV